MNSENSISDSAAAEMGHSEDIFADVNEEIQQDEGAAMEASNEAETENVQGNENIESDQNNDTLDENVESAQSDDTLNESTKSEDKLLKLPIARVKHIMKLDPDCSIVSADAVIVACKAAELFVSHLGEVLGKIVQNTKRKTVLKKDLDTAINSELRMCFLDGTLD